MRSKEECSVVFHFHFISISLINIAHHFAEIPTPLQGYGGLNDERGHHEEEVDAIPQYYDHERTISS